MIPQRRSAHADQFMLEAHSALGRHFGQQAWHVVALREAVADEQDLGRAWLRRLGHGKASGRLAEAGCILIAAAELLKKMTA